MIDAAEVLDPVRADVVVIGAVAVQVALDGRGVALTPTRDVDAGVPTEAVDRVVACLEGRGLRRSDVAHERSFTWVREDLKVQLLRPFHPFPRGAARGLPVQNLVGELDGFRRAVVFDGSPTRERFQIASPAALVALKGQAFGRMRASGEIVERDFSDAALLLDRLGEEIAAEVEVPSPMQARVRRAAQTLLADEAAIGAASRELVRAGQEESRRAAEAMARRGAERFLRRLDRGSANR
ncbi:MAG: hypothetical protein AB1416_12310 [Actinomycetota bacterium]